MDLLVKFTLLKVPFQWSEDYDEIFKHVQKVFSSKPFFSLPDCFKPFFLNIDASGTAITLYSCSKGMVLCYMFVTLANLSLLLKSDIQLLNLNSWQLLN